MLNVKVTKRLKQVSNWSPEGESLVLVHVNLKHSVVTGHNKRQQLMKKCKNVDTMSLSR